MKLDVSLSAERQRHSRRAGCHDQYELAPVHGVRQRPAQEADGQGRDHLGHADGAHGEGRTGEVVNLQWHRERGESAANRGKRRCHPQPAEGARLTQRTHVSEQSHGEKYNSTYIRPVIISVMSTKDNPGAAPGVVRDPTEQSLWRPLRLLQQAMDAEIDRVYGEAGIQGLKPSFVMELLRLQARGPMTITELADSVQRTHSGTSQKVAAMRAAGFVRTTTGTDGRSKNVVLTAKARKIVGQLAAEWRATEAAVAQLEEEIPYPLTQVVLDIEEALGRRSFHDRVAEKLAADPAWAGS